MGSAQSPLPDTRHVTDEPPAGVARLLKRRARRIPATYRLGHDASAPRVPRVVARVISAYERAPARHVLDVIDLDIWVDSPVLWLARRLTFAIAGRPRGDDDPGLDIRVPGSGWRGSLLVLAIWAALIAGALWVLQRWPVQQ